MSFPSYALWDSQNALAFYLATGSAIVPNDSPIGGDDGGTAQAHLELHQVPKALEVDYPWSPFFHFAVRQPSAYAKKTIAQALGIGQERVALALFSGLVLENTFGTLDTVTGALEAGWAAVKQAWSNAVSGNYYGVAADAAGTAAARGALSPAAADQDYYRVTVERREFKWALPSVALNILAAVEAAYASGTSIADALASFPDPNGFLSHLVALHRVNEARAFQAVTAPEFAPFAASLGANPHDLARGWLSDAGAKVDGVATVLVTKVPALSLLDVITRRPALRVDTSKLANAPRFAGQSSPVLQTRQDLLTPSEPQQGDIIGGYVSIPAVGRVSVLGLGISTAGAVAGALLMPNQRLVGAAIGGAAGVATSIVAVNIARVAGVAPQR